MSRETARRASPFEALEGSQMIAVRIAITFFCMPLLTATEDEEAWAIFNSLSTASDEITTYRYRYEGKHRLVANRQQTLGDEDAQPTYNEYDFVLSEVYDRGKRAFEVHRSAKLFDGKPTTEEEEHIKQTYDGEIVTLNERPNHYVLSREPAKYAGLTTPIKLRDRILSQIADACEAGRGSLQLEESKGATLLRARVRLSDDPESPMQTVLITLSSEYRGQVAGIASESFEFSLSGFREVSKGIVLPFHGEWSSSNEDGVLLDRKEMQLVDAEVNIPTLDPALFEMTIPADASVYHADLGIQTDAKEAMDSSDLRGLETLLLEHAESDVTQKRNPAQEPAADEDAQGSPPSQARQRPGPSGGAFLFRAAVIVAAVCMIAAIVWRARGKTRSP